MTGFDSKRQAAKAKLDDDDAQGYIADYEAALKIAYEIGFENGKKAQPEQEPVAWVCYGAPGKRDIDFEEADINGLPIGTNLYTTPPTAQRPWVGLTNEEIDSCWYQSGGITPGFARTVEAKLKEKNDH